jgi:hypothetical protein
MSEANLLPYQQRVIDELADLKEKCDKLDTFLQTRIKSVSPLERILLLRQHRVMLVYRDILQERIDNFESASSK